MMGHNIRFKKLDGKLSLNYPFYPFLIWSTAVKPIHLLTSADVIIILTTEMGTSSG